MSDRETLIHISNQSQGRRICYSSMDDPRGHYRQGEKVKCGHTPHPSCKELMNFFAFVCNVFLRNLSGVLTSQRGDQTNPVSLIQGCASKPWQSRDIPTRTSPSPTCFDGTVRIMVSEGSLNPRRIYFLGIWSSHKLHILTWGKAVHSRLWDDTQRTEVSP